MRKTKGTDSLANLLVNHSQIHLIYSLGRKGLTYFEMIWQAGGSERIQAGDASLRVCQFQAQSKYL